MLRSIQVMPVSAAPLQIAVGAEVKVSESISAITKTDLIGRTLFHSIATNGTAKQIQSACQELIENKCDHVLLQRDNNGMTPLHCAALGNNINAVKTILLALKDKTVRAVKIVDSNGDIPAELTSNLAILEILEPHMAKHNLCHYAEQVDLAQLLKRYEKEIKETPELENILTAACKAMNKVRSKIKYTRTHPRHTECKNFPIDMRRVIKKQREESSKQSQKLHAEFREYAVFSETREITPQLIQQEIKHLSQFEKQQIEFDCDLIRRDETADCEEYSTLMLSYFTEYCPSVKSSKVPILNGDHIAVLHNPNPLCSLQDFKNLGKACAASDAWSGDICLASEFPDVIQFFKVVKISKSTELRVTGPFNNDVHMLGETSSNKSMLEVMLDLPPEQQKKYLLVEGCYHSYHLKINAKGIRFHQIVKSHYFSTIRIFLKMIDDLKDDQLKLKLFSARDSANKTVLHYMAFQNSPIAMNSFLDEYRKILPDELPKILFGEELTDMQFIIDLYKSKAFNSIQAISLFFIKNEIITVAIKIQMKILEMLDAKALQKQQAPKAPVVSVTRVSLFSRMTSCFSTGQRTASVAPAP